MHLWWGLESLMCLAVDHCLCRGLQKLMHLERHRCQVERLTRHLSVPPLQLFLEFYLRYHHLLMSSSSCHHRVLGLGNAFFCLHFHVKPFSFNFRYCVSLCWHRIHSITYVLLLLSFLFSCNTSTDTLENRIYFV